ncbi:hypothetical protein B0H11DRAFT_2256812 [Mycena galericulata]|nr:hypothetical protein B0H11DRAFT_2256812 [Mycena galericulata]
MSSPPLDQPGHVRGISLGKHDTKEAATLLDRIAGDAEKESDTDRETTIFDTELDLQLSKNRFDECTYPVLTLANEIISEIFLHRVSLSKGPDLFPYGPESPLFLGHICRKWREIALSTPSLWTTIDLDPGDIATHESQLRLLAMIYTIAIWLTRSRDCSLSITLAHSPELAPPSRFIAAIVAHCKRWQEVNLWIPFRDLFLIQGEFPRLRTLRIGWNEPYSVARRLSSTLPLTIFHDAPKLDTIGLMSGWNLHLFLLSWERMTCIDLLGVPYPHELMVVLSTAPNITRFSAEILSSSDAESMARVGDIPPLLHLHSVELLHPLNTKPDLMAYIQLLDKLTLPNLLNLEVSEPCFPDTPIRAIESLIKLSGCPSYLLRIRVERAQYSRRHYRSKLPFVDSLTIKVDPFGDPDESEDEEEDSDEDGDFLGDAYLFGDEDISDAENGSD